MQQPVRTVHSSFTFQFARDRSNYRWVPAMGGGALYDVGCYTLSAARLVFGAEPVSAFAAARFDPESGVDLTAAALLEFPGGRLAICDPSFEAHFQSRLLAVGTEGTLLLDRAFSAKDFDVALAIVRGDVREAVRVSRADMFRLMAEHFADAVLGREPLRVPAADALGKHERDRRLLRVHPLRAARRHPLMTSSNYPCVADFTFVFKEKA